MRDIGNWVDGDGAETELRFGLLMSFSRGGRQKMDFKSSTGETALLLF
jgi:hypothetical protein